MQTHFSALDAAYASKASKAVRFAPASPMHGGAEKAPPLPSDAKPAPNLSFERNGFQIRIANGCDILKKQTAKLIERMYSARGLFPYGMHAELDRRDITIVALRDGVAAATFTLRIDRGAGLLAETLYSNEVDAVRKTGGKVCEITRLAIDPELGSHDALAGLFQALYSIARLTERITDIFVEVHPRHARFYQRIFGFHKAGPERICPRVGAAAVLLHLSEANFERTLSHHERLAEHGSHRARRLLPSEAELGVLLKALQTE